MSDKMGPGEFLTSQLTINFFIEEKSDIELQRLENSTEKTLNHKASAAQLSDLEFEYTNEEELIRNQIRNTDRTSDEYKELLAELDELQDEFDRKKSALEREISDKEEALDQQNIELETRYNAIEEDLKGLKEMQKSNIQGQ